MIVEGIVPAAGFSSRAGTYKLTLELSGKTVIEKCIEGMYDTCSRVIVIGGYNIERLAPVLEKYSKIELIYNENYRAGMFSSIVKGFMNAKGDRVFMIPGDYPLVSRDVYESLLKTTENIIVPTYKGTKGHPLLMNREMISLLLQKTGISNLREFISGQGFKTMEVDCPGILMDVDTPLDYSAAQNFLKQ